MAPGGSSEELEARLELMDSAQVQMQVLSVSPQLPYFEDGTHAVEAARVINDLYVDLGGALPMLLQRLDNQYRWAAPQMTEPPSTQARRMWYDTIGHFHVPALRLRVVRR